MPLADPAHERFMDLALAQARRALAASEVPIGAVVVSAAGIVVGEGFNCPVGSVDPTAHAEIIALRGAATAAGNYRLPGTTLYVTVEPCLMCVGAIVGARVATVVYGASEPKWGAIESIVRIADLPANHRFAAVKGVRADESRSLMVEFFRGRRVHPE